MPAVSKKQQKFFGIVRSVQKGEQSPTTPEVAKAASSMKKGDVKKFASTKHKGLPEKKKIEEDRQIKKIIKQLRKSVKAHDKQADTLEKKVKTFKESNFTNITTGMKVGQTFQHISGATVTVDNTMSNSSDQQQTVSISGEPVTAPTGNQLGIAGVTMPLGNKVMQKQNAKTAKQINKQTDASDKVSNSKSAKLDENLTLSEKKVEAEKFKKSMREWDKKSTARANTIRSRIKVQMSKVNSFLGRYGQSLPSKISIEIAKAGQGPVRIAQGGKKLLVISHSGFNYEDSKQFNVRVYKAEPGKKIYMRKGKFKYSGGSSILDNIFKRPSQSGPGTADTMYMNIGEEIENKNFAIKDIKEIPMPQPPEFMQKSAAYGWFHIMSGNAVSEVDEKFISKFEPLAKSTVPFPGLPKSSLPTGGLNLAAKLAVNYAKGDLTPITKSPGSGFDRVVINAIRATMEGGETEDNASKQKDGIGTNSYFNTKSKGGAIRYDVLLSKASTIKQIGYAPVTAALGQFNIKATDKGIQIIDDFDIDADSKNVGAAAILDPLTKFIGGTDVQETANRLVAIAANRAAELGFDMINQKGQRMASFDSKGNEIEPLFDPETNTEIRAKVETPRDYKIPINYTIPWSQIPPSVKSGMGYGNLLTGRQKQTIQKSSTKSSGFDRDDASFKRKKKKKKKKVNESILSEESNPRIPRKKGQPANSKKHSDLYTDENPKGTIHGLGFKDVATSKASVSKIRNSSRSHAHKIQAAVAMEQRAREMGKTSEAAVYRKYINSMKKKTKKMNEAANPAQQAAIAISMKKKGIKPKNLKEQISFPVMQQRIRDAKEKRREQQKKSEKLYMDTKKKGVKFYDKSGSGRIKDGKKIYD